MKALKTYERVQTGKIEEQLLLSSQQSIRTGMVSMLALVEMILLKRGWHKENVQKLQDDVEALLTVPDILGKTFDNKDVLEYVQNRGIEPMNIFDMCRFDETLTPYKIQNKQKEIER